MQNADTTVTFKFGEHFQDGDTIDFNSLAYQRFVKPNRHQTITLQEDLPKLEVYESPGELTYDVIRKNAKNYQFMKEKLFLPVMYLLIRNPALGKQLLGVELKKRTNYLLETSTGGATICSVFLTYYDKMWHVEFCDRMDDATQYYKGTQFLYFTKKKKKK